MAKTSVQFLCRTCGAVQPRWMGKCPDCGTWDSLEEFRVAKGATRDPQRGASGATDMASPGVPGVDGVGAAPKAMPIGEVGDATTGLRRLSTGIGEFDRVLGGGRGEGRGARGEGREKRGEASGTNASHPQSAIHNQQSGLVPGSAVLIGGDPGIGKSTLMLQAAHEMARRHTRVLYVTSEESVEQLRLRAARLRAGTIGEGVGADDANGAVEHGTKANETREAPSELFVLADTNLARIMEQVRQNAPAVVVVDSVQMIYKGDLAAAPGSVTQLRACCQELVYLAKASGIALLLVGHVTKQGQLAGPRLLEHLVDAVLYFEGDRYHNHRVVRGIKNRFGTTLEVGLFEMTDRGLKQVAGGSGLLATEYQARSGSVVCPVLQGSRCLLVELQALTATSFLGSAKRKASGIDGNRLAMLIAVLEKRGELRLADQDVFASSVGGMKVIEPAADLALALAIAGTHYNRTLGQGVCALGEIGLGGEVRHVQQIDQRLREAGRLGFGQVICPKIATKSPPGVELIPVESLDHAIQQLM